MADGNDQDGDGREPYNEYMIQIYSEGNMGGKLPPVTTDPNELEQQAKQKMSERGFWYVAGGANEGATMQSNRLAFKQWRIIPRMMKPAYPRDVRVKLFGETYDSPVIMAPIGVQSAYHPDKEVGTAQACADLGVPFSISTAASSTIEEIRGAVGNDAPLWYQLYWPQDDDITASLLGRAKAAGCKVLLVTMDTFSLSWRPKDLNSAFLPFVLGEGNAQGFSDPVVRQKFAEASDGQTPEENPLMASRFWLGQSTPGVARPWEDIAILKKYWDGPIVMKGILHPEDAKLALKHGADGIVVSNHGGRQVDGAVSSLEMLPEIVEAVGGKMTIIFDSGIRTAADIIKALSLGAQAVLVGRPVIYGLGIAGQKGARHILASLLADLDQTMSLSGIKSVADMNKGILRRAALERI